MASDVLKNVAAQIEVRGLRGAARDLERFERKVNATGTGISRMTRDVDNGGMSFSRLGNTIRRQAVSSLDSLDASASRLGRRLGTLGIAAGAVGIGLATAFAVDVVKTGAEYEDSFAGVLKVTEGLGDTLDSLTPKGEAVRQQFEDLSKEIPISVNELLKLGAVGGQLGVPEDKIAGFAKTMGELSVSIDGISAEDAALQLARLDSIANSSRGEYEKIGSVIVELGNNFATMEGPILENSMALIALKQNLDFSMPTLLAWGAAIEATGAKSEAVGTALTNIAQEMRLAAATNNESLNIFAETAGTSISKFKNLIETDGSKALSMFIAGLTEMEERGELSFLTLDKLGLADRRLVRELAKLGGGMDIVNSAITTANAEWEDANALAEESKKRFSTLNSAFAFVGNAIDRVKIAFEDLFRTDLKGFTNDLVGIFDEITDIVKDSGSVGEAISRSLDHITNDPKVREMATGIGEGIAQGIAFGLKTLVTLIPDEILSIIGAVIGLRAGVGGAIAGYNLFPGFIKGAVGGLGEPTTSGSGISRSIDTNAPISINNISRGGFSGASSAGVDPFGGFPTTGNLLADVALGYGGLKAAQFGLKKGSKAVLNKVGNKIFGSAAEEVAEGVAKGAAKGSTAAASRTILKAGETLTKGGVVLPSGVDLEKASKGKALLEGAEKAVRKSGGFLDDVMKGAGDVFQGVGRNLGRFAGGIAKVLGPLGFVADVVLSEEELGAGVLTPEKLARYATDPNLDPNRFTASGSRMSPEELAFQQRMRGVFSDTNNPLDFEGGGLLEPGLDASVVRAGGFDPMNLPAITPFEPTEEMRSLYGDAEEVKVAFGKAADTVDEITKTLNKIRELSGIAPLPSGGTAGSKKPVQVTINFPALSQLAQSGHAVADTLFIAMLQDPRNQAELNAYMDEKLASMYERAQAELTGLGHR